jgi:3-hydroxyisobutyrate dehydrogenase-like beta-hydroxyacid dehydrogenase
MVGFPSHIQGRHRAPLPRRTSSPFWRYGAPQQSAERAEDAGLEDVGDVELLRARSDVILCLCPPYVAVDIARSMTRFAGIYVDANAVSPATARTIAALVGRYVDGGIIGSPPRSAGTTSLYLSGTEATTIAGLFTGTVVEALVVADDPGAASAVKMAYAAWTKGTSALLLAVRCVARTAGVEEALIAEWRTSQPQLPEQSVAAARSALNKGWRWVGEMNEIAETFAAAGLPDGFHRGAAEIYRRSPHGPADGEDDLERVLSALLERNARGPATDKL